MATDVRVPVSKDTREMLHGIKRADETYDELLRELVRERQKKELAESIRNMKEADREDFIPLNPIDT